MFKFKVSKFDFYLSILFVILGFVLIPLSDSSQSNKLIWGVLALLHCVKIYNYFKQNKETEQ